MLYAIWRHMLAVCVLLALCADTSEAQIPRTISYQGTLYDAGGSPLPDGMYRISFHVYEAVDASAPMWSETHDAVVVRGVFTVYLGSIEPLDVDFSKPYWIEVQRDGETPLLPRLPFTAAPYAFIAERSLTADVADRAQTATTADRATVADSATVAGTAQTATTAQSAETAQTAVVADTARFVDGDFVTTLNDASGAITIKGAGATQVTTNGSEITISSIDGETVSAVLYAPDGIQRDLTDGTTFLFDVGYGDLTTSASGARITSRAGGEQGSATALTLIAEPTDSAEGIALMAQGVIESDTMYRIKGMNALRLDHDEDSTSIAIGPGALATEIDRRGRVYHSNIAIGSNALDTVTGSGNIGIGRLTGANMIEGFFGAPNVYIGHHAGRAATLTVVNDVVLIGQQAGDSSDVDQLSSVTAVGSQAAMGIHGDLSYDNVFIGTRAGQYSDMGGSVVIGADAGEHTRESGSVIIGDRAGRYRRGGNNVIIGNRAGSDTFNDTSRSHSSVFIGENAGRDLQKLASHLVAVGYNSQIGEDVTQQAVAIGPNSYVNSSFSLSLGAQRFGGGLKVGIATPTPTRFLDVNGDARIGRKGTTIKDIILLDTDEQPGGRIQSGQQRRLDIAVDGATVGASVTATPYPPLPMGVMIANAYVESADNVRVTLYNFSDDFVDMENMTFKLLVVQ